MQPAATFRVSTAEMMLPLLLSIATSVRECATNKNNRIRGFWPLLT